MNNNMGYLYLSNNGKQEYYLEIDENNVFHFYFKGETLITNAGVIIANKSSRNADGTLNYESGKTEILKIAKEFTKNRIGKDEATVEDIIAYVKRKRLEREENKKRESQIAIERNAKKHKACKIILNTRMKNGVLESNYANIYLLLEYLNTQNWGGWELPKMTIGYSCAQYDCDGKQATTIKLDEPIDDEGEMVSRYQVGAPHRHLMKYHRICDWDTLEEIKSLMEEL